jgi:hypothetical protein
MHVSVNSSFSHFISELHKCICHSHCEDNSQYPLQKSNWCLHDILLLTRWSAEFDLNWACSLNSFSVSIFILLWISFFSLSSKFSCDTPLLRSVRILRLMAVRLNPKIWQSSCDFIFSIQRSLASFVKSILTPFHRTSTVLIASGCSTTCSSLTPIFSPQKSKFQIKIKSPKTSKTKLICKLRPFRVSSNLRVGPERDS